MIETANPGTGFDAGQSRFDFSLNTILFYGSVSVLFAGLLAFTWKKIIPYQVPALTFVTALLLHNLILSVTIGWIGLAATLILFSGTVLSCVMVAFVWIVSRRLKKQVVAGG